MLYYKREIGDYYKKAGRLSMLQHGAYTLLLDACYDREKFPTFEEAIEWCWASSQDEIDAVEFVLNRFFDKQENGTFAQKHVAEELEKYHTRCDENKRIAIERETKRKKNNTKRARVENEPPPNNKQLTINNKQLTINNKYNSDKSELCDVGKTNKNLSLKPDKPKKSKYNFSADHHAMASLMAETVKPRFPSQKIKIDQWADAIRKLETLDKRDRQDILDLWNWILHHEDGDFSWADQIRTPMKLRERDRQGTVYFEKLWQQRSKYLSKNNSFNDLNTPRSTRNLSIEDELSDTSWADN